MNRKRTCPVITRRARTSGSVSVEKLPHAAHSKSPNSTTSTGAVSLPTTCPELGIGVTDESM